MATPMAKVLLFHHAQGLTRGLLAFADELRVAGHVVHAPDLYEGRTFTELDHGVAFAKEVGFDTSSTAAASPPRTCRTSSSTAASRSARCRRRC